MDIQKMEAAAKAATPGPWSDGYGSGVSGGRAAAACSWDCTDVHSFPVRAGKNIVAWVACFTPSEDEKKGMEKDAAFIAAANPAAVLKLIESHGKLVSALRFYADAGAWDAFRSDEAASAFDRNFGSDLGDDNGARAREALAEVAQ